MTARANWHGNACWSEMAEANDKDDLEAKQYHREGLQQVDTARIMNESISLLKIFLIKLRSIVVMHSIMVIHSIVVMHSIVVIHSIVVMHSIAWMHSIVGMHSIEVMHSINMMHSIASYRSDALYYLNTNDQQKNTYEIIEV